VPEEFIAFEAKIPVAIPLQIPPILLLILIP